MARHNCMMFSVPPEAADAPPAGPLLPPPVPVTVRQFAATARVRRPDRDVRCMPAFDVYVLPVAGDAAYR